MKKLFLSEIANEFGGLPERLDLGCHFSSIFPVHQLCVGHQHQNLFTCVVFRPLHLVTSKFLEKTHFVFICNFIKRKLNEFYKKFK